MIAVDTNLLVYAHRPESPLHTSAFEVLAGLAGGRPRWGLPIHCLIEFSAAVSNPRIFRAPSTAHQIRAQLDGWLNAPSARVLGEDAGFVEVFCDVLESSAAAGGMVHDARIASCCRYHGVSELWTADRDFGRFPFLKTRNPLVA